MCKCLGGIERGDRHVRQVRQLWRGGKEIRPSRSLVDRHVGLWRPPDGIRQAIRTGKLPGRQEGAERLAPASADALWYTAGGDVGEDKVLELARQLAKRGETRGSIIREAKRESPVQHRRHYEARRQTADPAEACHLRGAGLGLGIYANREGSCGRKEAAADILDRFENLLDDS